MRVDVRPYVQFRWLLGGNEVTRNRYEKAFADFCRLYPEINDNNHQCIPSSLILCWMFDLWDAGYSASEFVCSVMAMDAYCMVRDWPLVSSRPEVVRMIKRYVSNYNKRKVPRAAVSFEDAVRLASFVPRRIPRVEWAIFIALGWVFMLRHSEARYLKPSDIQMPSEKNNHTWILFIRNPKVNVAGWNTVIMPDALVPQCFKPLLCRFASSRILWNWNVLVPAHWVCPTIRQALNRRDDLSLVFHSLRHGRATHLFKVSDVTLEALQKMGRWSTLSSVKVYLHC